MPSPTIRAAVACSFNALASFAAAQAPCTPNLVGQLGGRPNDVALAGDIAYVAYGSSGLLLVDTTQSPPTIVNQIDFGGYAEGIDIENGIAVVVGSEKLWTFDTSTPANPLPLGSLGGFVAAERVEIDGGLAYVTDRAASADEELPGPGLWTVIDLSAPSNPEVLASITAPSQTREVAVGDGFAVVACNHSGIVLYDISDPHSIAEIASHNAGNHQYVSVSIDDDRLAALRLAGTSGSTIDVRVEYFDVTDPSNPVLLGEGLYETEYHTGWDADVELRDSFAYVARMKNYIALNFLNPNNVTHRVVTNRPSAAQALTPTGAVVVGPYMYSHPTHHKPEFSLVEHGWPPTWTGRLVFPGPAIAFDVDAEGDLAAVADQQFGVVLVDISDPANPAHISTIAGSAYGVDLVDDTLYVGGGSLRIYDVSDPAAPIFVADSNDFRPTADYVQRVRVCDDVAVGLGSTWYMFPFDISDPTAPYYHRAVFTPSNIGSEWAEFHALTVHDGIAYAAATDDVMYALDVTDPMNPVTLGYDWVHIGYTANACYDNGHVYVSGAGVQVFDVTDPSNVTTVGYIHLDGYYETAIHVRDGIAHIYARDGILTYDVADPANPVLLSVGEIPRMYTYVLAENDGLMYSANWDGGLKIHDLSACAPCYADLDGNWVLNIDDLDLFISAFLSASLDADCDGSGTLNVDDVDCFVASFLAGCG